MPSAPTGSHLAPSRDTLGAPFPALYREKLEGEPLWAFCKLNLVVSNIQRADWKVSDISGAGKLSVMRL